MYWLYLPLAALFTAFSNLFIRISVGRGGAAGDPFLIYRLLSSALVIVLIALSQGFPLYMDRLSSSLGIFAGSLLGSLMWLTGRSLKYGGPGLSFMVINTACMAPPLFMAILFGKEFGHVYEWKDALGALLMIGGIVVGSFREGDSKISRKWLYWISLTFIVHAVFLSYFQWRALLLKEGLPASPLLPFQCSPEGSDCFGIFLFLTAALFQLFLPRNQVVFKKSDLLLFGIGGGFINGLGSYFMIKTTESALLPVEKTLLFPAYSILLIFLCNLWGYFIYEEKISWKGTALSSIGILISCWP